METTDKIKTSMEHCAGSRPCAECAYDNKDFPYCIMRQRADALAYIQQLEALVPRWISVEERLPESYISVIGYLPIEDKEGHPPTREVYRTEKGWFAPALSELCIVTHWQPLPKPPEEVQHE